MKKWFVAGGIVIGLLIGGYLVLSFYAVKRIQPQVEKMMRTGLAVAKVEMKATCISVQKIEYEDPHSRRKIFQIAEVKIYPSLFSFLMGRLNIREVLILQPSFHFCRSREGTLVGLWFPMKKREKDQEVLVEAGKDEEGPLIGIDRILIKKGSFDFEDQKYESPPSPIQVREVRLRLENIRYPIVSALSPFELWGKIEGRTKEGQIEAKGWIDLGTGDTESIIKVHKAEVKMFEPYYRKRVSAEIESGYFNLEVKIDLKQERISVPGSMELVDLRIKEQGRVFWIPAKALVSLLKNKGNSLKGQFHVKGNIKDPKFDLQETILTRLAFSLGEALGLPFKSSLGEASLGGAAAENGKDYRRD